MNTVRPRPYPQRGTGNYNAGNEGADKDGHNPNQGQQQNQDSQTVARGRVQDIQQNVGQPRQAIYSPANNAYPQKQTYQVHTPPPPVRNAYPPIQHKQINPQQYQAMQAGYHQISPQQAAPIQQPMQPSNPRRNNKVNIAQILKDFRNTIKAIATPKDIEENVNHYLQIVEQQVREANPQVNLIQSNLKVAASLLDKYISETLNKESKVVQNWLDALFLQRINYNYNADEINPNFLVKFPDESEKKPEEQPAKAAKPKINKMDIILIIIAVTLFVFTVKMISLFEQYQSVPDTLITAVFAVCGGECGVMGWIKTNNERYRERQWQLEDQAAINGNTGEV